MPFIPKKKAQSLVLVKKGGSSVLKKKKKQLKRVSHVKNQKDINTKQMDMVVLHQGGQQAFRFMEAQSKGCNRQ